MVSAIQRVFILRTREFTMALRIDQMVRNGSCLLNKLGVTLDIVTTGHLRFSLLEQDYLIAIQLSQHFWQLSFSICYCYGCWTSEWHIETIWLHTATIVALHHLQHLDSSPAGLNSCQQTVGETWTSPCAPYLVVYCPPSCRKVTGCLRRTILVS